MAQFTPRRACGVTNEKCSANVSAICTLRKRYDVVISRQPHLALSWSPVLVTLACGWRHSQ
ncbi:hypothetical protein KCP70_11215 [Salmonella enterica subsp. enterica]|nr:hypothetical protein KCP70_11215 [Salmonella enterica subsp. enterica]